MTSGEASNSATPAIRRRCESPPGDMRGSSQHGGLRFKKKPRTELTSDSAPPNDTSQMLRHREADPGSGPTPPQVPPYVVRAEPYAWPSDLQALPEEYAWARGLAHAFTENNTLCVIALNEPWIPRPVVGRVQVRLCADGRFGVEDPLNWPQLYSDSRPYLALIPRKPRSASGAGLLWETPCERDFVRANDDHSGGAFGYLRLARLTEVRKVVRQLEEELDVFKQRGPPGPAVLNEASRLHAAVDEALSLFGIPSSYRDLLRRWGRLHRCWAECWAYMRWHQIVSSCRSLQVPDHASIPLAFGLDGSGVMGALCTNPATAQKLLLAGVPVWLLQPRHTVGDPQVKGRTPVPFTEPSAVEQGQDHVLGDVRSTVLAGDAHLEVISRESEAVLDIAHALLPAALGLEQEDETGDYITRQSRLPQKKPTQRVRATERLSALEHPLLPPRVDAWQQALDRLDRTTLCERREGLWFPEPELVITPSSPVRLLVYISNWMAIRVPLFSKLGHYSLYPALGPNSWRTILSRFPEPSEEEKQALETTRKSALPRNTAKHARGGMTRAQNRGGLERGTEGSGDAQAQSSAGQRRHEQSQAICAYFTDFLGFQHRPFALHANPISSFTWRGREIPLNLRQVKASGELPLPADVARELAWELGDVAFRVELWELDRRVVTQDGGRTFHERRALLSNIFPGNQHWSRPQVPPDAHSLSASDVRSRLRSLEGLRNLLCRWQGCPSHFSSQPLDETTPDEALLQFEREAAAFYCETAYRKFGRAPAVPRQVPSSLSEPPSHS